MHIHVRTALRNGAEPAWSLPAFFVSPTADPGSFDRADVEILCRHNNIIYYLKPFSFAYTTTTTRNRQ